MACNHGFTDGNKRTALLLMDLLLRKSGYALVAAGNPDDLNDEIEDMLVAVAAGQMPFD